MKQFVLIVLAIPFSFFCYSQNVGIGNPTPAEKLDVNGNVNITGTIKANGVTGQKGQVLMSTGTGLSWGSTAGYRKSKSFSSSGAGSFTVPAGVTEVMIEAWGAGSGGTVNSGGTSGGYARTVKSVNPGDVINLSIGLGSNYGATTTLNGGNTTVSFGADVLTAFGGGGVVSAGTKGDPKSGTFSGSFDNTYFFYGAEGKATSSSGFLKDVSTYVEIVDYGSGGIPTGFMNPVASPGDHLRYENGTSVTAATVVSQNPRFPSAGGSAGFGLGGWNGASGFVVIWWN